MEKRTPPKKMSWFEIVLYLYIGGGVFFIFFGPEIVGKTSSSNEASSKQRICYSNIRVIQGAIEMYNADKTPMMKDYDVDILLQEKYLKSKPKPPEKNCHYSSDGDLSNGGEIVCDFHGGLEKPGKFANSRKESFNSNEYKKHCGYRICAVVIWPYFYIMEFLCKIGIM